MDEDRKRVIGIMAAILTSLYMRTADDVFGGPQGSPRRDGFALVKAVRAANPSCVVIILTGYPDFESAVEGINCGVDGYFVKPADIETLLTAIQERLAAKNSRQS